MGVQGASGILSLEVFKRYLDMALGVWFGGDYGNAKLERGVVYFQ